jgi:hypothetical protein
MSEAAVRIAGAGPFASLSEWPATDGPDAPPTRRPRTADTARGPPLDAASRPASGTV